jgi:cell division FtsZ-interacting protein ZapD
LDEGGFPIATRAEQAQERLEKALARLEQAVERNAQVDTGLAQELEQARREIGQLKDQNQTVTHRLDAAIGRMKAVLEE